jgi:hypothetical protein
MTLLLLFGFLSPFVSETRTHTRVRALVRALTLLWAMCFSAQIDLTGTRGTLKGKKEGCLFYARLDLQRVHLRSRKRHGPSPKWRDRFLFILNDPFTVGPPLNVNVSNGVGK